MPLITRRPALSVCLARPSLVRALIRLAGIPRLIIIATLEASTAALNIFGPLVLQQLVLYLYTADASTSPREGILWAFAFLGIGVCSSMVYEHQTRMNLRMVLKVQSSALAGGLDDDLRQR